MTVIATVKLLLDCNEEQAMDQVRRVLAGLRRGDSSQQQPVLDCGYESARAAPRHVERVLACGTYEEGMAFRCRGGSVEALLAMSTAHLSKSGLGWLGKRHARRHRIQK